MVLEWEPDWPQREDIEWAEDRMEWEEWEKLAPEERIERRIMDVQDHFERIERMCGDLSQRLGAVERAERERMNVERRVRRRRMSVSLLGRCVRIAIRVVDGGDEMQVLIAYFSTAGRFRFVSITTRQQLALNVLVVTPYCRLIPFAFRANRHPDTAHLHHFPPQPRVFTGLS